jgi:hypothetical protein
MTEAETNMDDRRIREGSEALAAIILISREVDLEAIREIAGASQRFDTITSMLDPTRWMREHKAVAASSHVAAAFLKFRKVIDEESA